MSTKLLINQIPYKEIDIHEKDAQKRHNRKM